MHQEPAVPPRNYGEYDGNSPPYYQQPLYRSGFTSYPPSMVSPYGMGASIMGQLGALLGENQGVKSLLGILEQALQTFSSISQMLDSCLYAIFSCAGAASTLVSQFSGLGKLLLGTTGSAMAKRWRPAIAFLVSCAILPYLARIIMRFFRNALPEAARATKEAPSHPFATVTNSFAGINDKELSAEAGTLVAVLSADTKESLLAKGMDWWWCRTEEGRTGYLPRSHLRLLQV